MIYHVKVTARAERDIRRIYRDINAKYSAQAHAWFDGLEAAILSLAAHPARGGAVPEGGNLRHLLYGHRPHIYRIIYAVDDSQHIVRVLHIRHGARQALA